MSVPLKLGSSVEVGTPKPLFSVSTRFGEYEVSPDGKQFLVNTNAGVPSRPLTVTTNWANAIKR